MTNFDKLKDDVTEAWEDLKFARSRAKEAARLYAEELIEQAKVQWQVAAGRAARAGVPQKQIAEAMNYKHIPFVKGGIEAGLLLTADEAREDETEGDATLPTLESATTYTYLMQPGMVKITLSAEDLEPFGGTESAAHVFHVADGIVTPDRADEDETWMLPIVRAVTSPSTPWREMVLAANEGVKQ